MKRVWLLAAAGLIAGGLWFGWRSFASPPASPPAVDVAHLHPLVADVIREVVAEVEARPDSAAAWGELAMVLIAHDLGDAARECLAQAARIDPGDFRWPYFVGYSLEDSDYQAALDNYSRALELRPEYLPLRVRMAQIWMRLGDLDQCEQVLVDGREFEPGNPYLIITQGRTALLKNDYQQAEDLFGLAAQVPGWTPQPAYLELIKLANRRGDHEQAYEYQRRLAVLPEVAKMEFPDPALEEIRSFEGLSKSLAERADFALARGDLPAAVTAYELFLRRRQDMSSAYVNLAQAYAMSGRYSEAIRTYQTVLERFGDVLSAHLGLAGTYERAGRLELAAAQYRRVLEIKPNHKDAWFMLGLLHEGQGDLDEAIACYREAAAVDSAYPQAQLALGVALLKQNRPADARPFIARAAALVPGDPVPERYLRQVDEKLKDVER